MLEGAVCEGDDFQRNSHTIRYPLTESVSVLESLVKGRSTLSLRLLRIITSEADLLGEYSKTSCCRPFKCCCCRKKKDLRIEAEERKRVYLALLRDYQDYVQFYSTRENMSLIHSIRDKDDFDNQLKEAGAKLIVVDFYATWCGPCKVIAPKLEEMAQQYTDVIFLKVDVDDCEEIASQYGISCMPTFMFFKKGEKVAEISGANADKVRELVASNK